MDASNTTGYPPLRKVIFACALLCFSMMVSLIDRQILSLMVVPIRADLGITDTQIALLQGLAFILFYLSAGLVLGYMVDRYSRRNLVIFSIVGWSGMTVICGVAGNFWQLFVARLGVGLGQAGLHPSVYSLLCDYFAPGHRGRAFGIVGLSASCGIGLALLGGGALYGWLSQLGPILGGIEVWKLTFIVAGLPGLVLALMFLTLKEPIRRETTTLSQTVPASTLSILSYAHRNWSLLIPAVAHYTILALSAYAIMGWVPAFYMRVYGASVLEAGAIAGTIVLIGSLGALVSGFLGDHWVKVRAPGGRLRAAIVTALIGTPALLIWFLGPNKSLSIAAGSFAWSMISVTLTIAPLALADLVPNTLRGQITAGYLFVNTAVGAGCGPLLVALVTDHVFADDSRVNYSLAIVTVPAFLLAGLTAGLLLRKYDAATMRFHGHAALEPVDALRPSVSTSACRQ